MIIHCLSDPHPHIELKVSLGAMAVHLSCSVRRKQLANVYQLQAELTSVSDDVWDGGCRKRHGVEAVTKKRVAMIVKGLLDIIIYWCQFDLFGYDHGWRDEGGF